MAISTAKPIPAQGPAIDPRSPITLIDHKADMLGEAHGFGGFLFGRSGRPVIEDGKAWLYTTRIVNGKWESWVRRFDLNTLQSGPARPVLLPCGTHDRAVLHNIITIADDLIVGLYCDGVGVSAGIATRPDAEFISDEGFVFRPEPGWETRAGGVEGWSLESNGGFVLCEDNDDETLFWQGYDSYRKDGRLGDLGWAKIRVDKKKRRVALVNRHPANPLAFRDPQWLCARCGGNLSNDVRIGGKRAFFYYIGPSMSDTLIGLALSDDPLFIHDVRHYVVGTVLGQETVAEKFQAIQSDGVISVFYESRFQDSSWHTGIRRYIHAP